MSDVTITPTDSGPYLVAGNVTLRDAEGNEYEVGDTIALCRCGHSSTKPFCDGAHLKANFAALTRQERGLDDGCRLRAAPSRAAAGAH